MACPFGAYFAQKSDKTGNDNKDDLSKPGRKSPVGDGRCVESRKSSISKLDSNFQHQGSFSIPSHLSSGQLRDEVESRMIRSDAPNRIVWERGPSLEHLKGPNGVGVVQQRVHSFTQQQERSENLSLPYSINRSVSSSAVGSASSVMKSDSSDIRRPKTSRGREERPLLKNPKEPPDPRDPLSLKILTEAVWSFVTIPVSIGAKIYNTVC